VAVKNAAIEFLKTVEVKEYDKGVWIYFYYGSNFAGFRIANLTMGEIRKKVVKGWEKQRKQLTKGVK
jgi:hypothetical protein